MNISINLSSQPFRRDRNLLIGSVLAGILLFALLCMLVTLNLLERNRLASTRSDVDRTERQLRTIAAEQARIEAVLRRPENAQVLDRSIFLNGLIYRKGISWTKLFADLEQILPYNVRLFSIRPSVTSQNQVMLEMLVGADQEEPLLQLQMKLESSESFSNPSVPSVLPPSQSEPLFRYKINVNYAQKL